MLLHAKEEKRGEEAANSSALCTQSVERGCVTPQKGREREREGRGRERGEREGETPKFNAAETPKFSASETPKLGRIISFIFGRSLAR